MEEGRDADAIAQAAEIIEKYPDSPQAVDALAIKANAEYRTGRATNALASYSALEERASEAADVNAARMGIMRVSRDMGENERAIESADRLLACISSRSLRQARGDLRESACPGRYRPRQRGA